MYSSLFDAFFTPTTTGSNTLPLPHRIKALRILFHYLPILLKKLHTALVTSLSTYAVTLNFALNEIVSRFFFSYLHPTLTILLYHIFNIKSIYFLVLFIYFLHYIFLCLSIGNKECVTHLIQTAGFSRFIYSVFCSKEEWT